VAPFSYVSDKEEEEVGFHFDEDASDFFADEAVVAVAAVVDIFFLLLWLIGKKTKGRKNKKIVSFFSFNSLPLHLFLIFQKKVTTTV